MNYVVITPVDKRQKESEMSLFGADNGLGGDSFSKMCHTYETIMKPGTVIPYLKKIQNIYKSIDRPL